MATLNFNVVKNPFVSQNLRGSVGRYTGPASYSAADGDSLVSQELKIGQVAGMWFEPMSIGGVLYLAVYDISNETVRWYVASTGVEVADAVDLSGGNSRFLAVGS